MLLVLLFIGEHENFNGQDFSQNTDSYGNLDTSHGVTPPLDYSDDVSVDISGSQSTSLPKNYVSCTVCRAVIHKHSLARHMLLHSVKRPFACQLCNKQFITKSTLNIHARKCISDLCSRLLSSKYIYTGIFCLWNEKQPAIALHCKQEGRETMQY